MSEDDRRAARKLAAKRVDERVKLLASFFNALAVGAIAAGVIIPATKTPAETPWISVAWLSGGCLLHLFGQGIYRSLRGEG